MRNRIFTIFLVVIAAIFFVGCGEKIGPNNNNGGGSGVGKNGLFANGSPIGAINLTLNGEKVDIDEAGRVGRNAISEIKAKTNFNEKQLVWAGYPEQLGLFAKNRIVLALWEKGKFDSDNGYTIYFNNDFKLSEVKPGLKIERHHIRDMKWIDSNTLTDEDYLKWSTNYGYENYCYKVDYNRIGKTTWWKVRKNKTANYNISGNITVVSINQEYATITLKFNNFVMGTYHDDKTYPINPYPLLTLNGTAVLPMCVLD